MADQVRVLVGTRKGAFVYTSNAGRDSWEISEPMLAGWQIHHMVADPRADPPRFYAAANHAVWGPSVAKSSDGGKTWDRTSSGLGFPEDMGLSIYSVWHVRPGHENAPGVVFAGTGPGGLFRSEDWGASWTPNDAINRHDYRPFWQPVRGGPQSADEQHVTMTLHSIEIDPHDLKHMYISISGGAAM